ncbi:MAG: carboxypeptidase-like regulatory domain-containing protein [Pseudomonadota bacterium]
MSAFLQGVVVSSDGTPVSGAAVMITAAPEPVPDIAIITDSHGEFMLENLPAGHYSLEIAARGDIGRADIELYDLSMTEVTINLIAKPQPRPLREQLAPDIGVLLEPNTADPTLDPFAVLEYDPDTEIVAPESDERGSEPQVLTPKKSPKTKSTKRKTAKSASKSTTAKRKPKSKSPDD